MCVKQLLTKFVADRGGVTSIEYAMIAAGIALAIVTVVFAIGAGPITDLYQAIVDAVSSDA